jgi:CHAT domain-containing protein/tetratricopeptide (TPR) repeat protein
VELFLLAFAVFFGVPAAHAENEITNPSHAHFGYATTISQAELAKPKSTDVENWVKQAEELEARGDNRRALDVRRKILAWRDRNLGPEHPETFTSLVLLAVSYQLQGSYSKALPLYQRALAIREKTLGPEHKATVVSLNNLALVYDRLGRYAEASSLFKRMLVINEKTLGAEHPETVFLLARIAGLLQVQGRYEEAEKVYKRVLNTQTKVLGPENFNTLNTVSSLASVYDRLARYADAEPLYKRRLANQEKALGPDHPETAFTLASLAANFRAQARYSEAEQLQMRVNSIINKEHDPKNLYSPTSLFNLAQLYYQHGRHGEAERLFVRALAINEAQFPGVEGPEQPITVSILIGLANVFVDQGRYGEAELIYKRVLANSEKMFGMEHPDTALSLNNLASLYQRQARYSESFPLFSRILEINRKSLGRAHPDTAISLNSLALIFFKWGNYAQAERLFTVALDIREKSLGPENFATGASLNNLALLYANQGRSDESESLYQRALAISEKAYGPEHPSTIVTLNNLALLHLHQKDYASARALLSRVSRTQGNWLVRELPLQPRELRAGLLAEQSDAPATIYALLDQDPGARELALQTRLNRQGLLAEIEQRQQRLAGSGPQTRELAERIAGIDRQLASVSLPAERRPELQKQRLQLEGDLYRSLPSLRIEAVSTAQVAAALPRQGALVEFQRYRPWQVAGGGKGEWGKPRYVALVLHADGRSMSVPLGEAAAIDAAVAKAHGATAKNEVDPAPLWAEVSRLVLDPLQPQLGGVEDLFLSPDGELHRIPFAVLPGGKDRQRLLSEAVRLRVVTTGRDLVRLQQPARAGGAPVVMANPAYGATTGTPGGKAGGQQRASALRGALKWDPLPATKAEATQVAGLLGAGAPIVEEQATAARALQQKGPLIFHIATHGFFFPAPESEERKGGRAAPGLGVAEDPLLRSGLVLSGANAPERNPADDGYLTAAEATGMDLEGTELVVLSACETGLGDVRSGEGVYGLQRAFTVAGSRATLLSLWKVDDAATAAFMAAYYGRLRQGEGRAEALRATQADFRRHADPLYRDAYVWGAFQLTGDWRPIERLGSGKGNRRL